MLLISRAELLELKKKLEKQRDELSKQNVELKEDNEILAEQGIENMRLKRELKQNQISGLYHPLLIHHLELKRELKEVKEQLQPQKVSRIIEIKPTFFTLLFNLINIYSWYISFFIFQ